MTHPPGPAGVQTTLALATGVHTPLAGHWGTHYTCTDHWGTHYTCTGLGGSSEDARRVTPGTATTYRAANAGI